VTFGLQPLRSTLPWPILNHKTLLRTEIIRKRNIYYQLKGHCSYNFTIIYTHIQTLHTQYKQYVPVGKCGSCTVTIRYLTPSVSISLSLSLFSTEIPAYYTFYSLRTHWQVSKT